MEMYVESKLREAVEPIIERLNEIYDLVPDHSNKIIEMQNELKKVDEHYMHCCRAICATQGLVLKDVNAHNIQQEYLKILSKEKTRRKQNFKRTQLEQDNMYHHVLTSGNHFSDEEPLSDAFSGKEDQEPTYRGSSNSNSREPLDRTVPKLIKLKSRGLNIKAALQENINKKFADDDGLMQQIQANLQQQMENLDSAEKSSAKSRAKTTRNTNL